MALFRNLVAAKARHYLGVAAFGAFAAFGTSACEVDPPVEATSDVAEAGASPIGADAARDGTLDSSSAAPPDAGPPPDCEPLDLAETAAVTAEFVTAASPTPVGGAAPADGDYRFVRYVEYDPPAFDAGPPPGPLLSRMRISGSGRYVKSTNAFPGGPYTQVSRIRYEDTRYFVQPLCPTPSATETSGRYTSDGDRVDFFVGLVGSRVVVSTSERTGP